ncbi:MAG: molybdate ABC transporter substrate-binding protein [Peptostreptococcaceae bacterium]
MNKKLRLILSMSMMLFTVGCNIKNNAEKIELNISAASSTKEVMERIKIEYEKSNSDTELIINYGGSGSLQQQIEQGAPCDIIISASNKQIKELSKKGLLLEESITDLSKNELVLITPKDSNIIEISDLLKNKVMHIAMGEPSSVPAGEYAKEATNNLNIYNSIKNKIVYAKDVKEVLAWVMSSNAEAGFVYYTDAINNEKVKIVEKINANNHKPITYPIAIVKDSKNIEKAKEFQTYLLSLKGQAIFEEFGYKK